MEVRKQHDPVRGTTDRQAVAGKYHSDITRQNRESIREVAEPKRLDRKDRIELSTTAQSLKAEYDEKSEARAERVEELRAAHEAGTLNDAERVERAAQGLLGED